MTKCETVPGHDAPEKRRADRKRALLSGIVVHTDGAYSLKCTIKSISDSGARIAISNPGQQLPPSVYLINLRDQHAHEAKIVWHRGAEFGISFVNSFALATLVNPALTYLRRLWLATTMA